MGRKRKSTQTETDIEVKREIASALSERSLDRLIKIPIDSLSVNQIITMLKLTMEEERKALGLP